MDRERVARDVGMRGSAQVANSDLAEVWARSLDGLADLQIQPHQRAWLKLTRPLGLVENTALIATPNEFVKEQLETRLRALVTQALSQQLGRDIQLAVTVDPAPQAAMPGSGPGQDLGPGAPEAPVPLRPGLAGSQVPEADYGLRPPAPHRQEPPRVGFAVSRAVGPAVTRNRVNRRLRALMRGYLQSLPGGSLLVVRANAAAAHASQPDLAADLDSVISRLLRRQVGARVGNAR